MVKLNIPSTLSFKIRDNLTLNGNITMRKLQKSDYFCGDRALSAFIYNFTDQQKLRGLAVWEPLI